MYLHLILLQFPCKKFSVDVHRIKIDKKVLQLLCFRIKSITRRSEHITPILQDLHWLPVPQRIEFKVLVLTFKAIHGLAPVYLRNLVSVRGQSRFLRSSSRVRLFQPKPLCSAYADRAFASAAPRLWNKLPPRLTTCTDIMEFRALLKTFWFKSVFPSN